MQHSIIVRLCKKIFKITKQYYRFSIARKMVNGISAVIRNFFINSFIYKLFTRENNNVPKFLESSVLGKIEVLFQKILNFLHQLYHRGILGSFVLKFEENIKKTWVGFISLTIIGAVAAYNLLSFINGKVNNLQLYISAIIVFLTINVYFLNTRSIYENSFIKKIVDSIFQN